MGEPIRLVRLCCGFYVPIQNISWAICQLVCLFLESSENAVGGRTNILLHVVMLPSVSPWYSSVLEFHHEIEMEKSFRLHDFLSTSATWMSAYCPGWIKFVWQAKSWYRYQWWSSPDQFTRSIPAGSPKPRLRCMLFITRSVCSWWFDLMQNIVVNSKTSSSASTHGTIEVFWTCFYFVKFEVWLTIAPRIKLYIYK